MNRFFAGLLFLISCFFVLSSCQIGSSGSILSSKVLVRVAPSRIRPINLTGGKQVCRPRPFSNFDARKALKENSGLSLSKDFLDSFFGEGSQTAPPDYGERQNQPVRVDVGDNWLNFSLEFVNGNQGENNYFLMIKNINYNALAIYKKQVFKLSGTVGSEQCGGPPYLYLIPPARKIIYSPLSENPFENLTIFLSGFPIIDRSNQLSPSLQNRARNIEQQGQGVASVSLQDSSYRPNEIIVIPRYTVELTLRGDFIKKSDESATGELIPFSPFVKRVKFRAVSSLR